MSIAFEGECSSAQKSEVNDVVSNILEVLADKIDGLNFWERKVQVSELEGKIQEILILSGVPELEATFEQITTELLNLAKRRAADILSAKHETEPQA